MDHFRQMQEPSTPKSATKVSLGRSESKEPQEIFGTNSLQKSMISVLMENQ